MIKNFYNFDRPVGVIVDLNKFRNIQYNIFLFFSKISSRFSNDIYNNVKEDVFDLESRFK